MGNIVQKTKPADSFKESPGGNDGMRVYDPLQLEVQRQILEKLSNIEQILAVNFDTEIEETELEL